MKYIYCDHAATTPIDPKVLEIMSDVQKNIFGNPSSIHQFGQSAKARIEKARTQISNAIQCSPREICFTSGGSESNNMVIKNILKSGDHIISSSIEHPAILEPIKNLKSKGIESTLIKPDQNGIIDIKKIQNAIKKNTKLVSIMFVNNELGTINPIKKIGDLLNKKNILFHTDAVQAFGKVDLDLSKIHVNFLSLSGHKFYGPKGTGILYINKNNKITPLISGGSQENKIRAGTENVAGISGIGYAAELAIKRINNNTQKLNKLTKLFLDSLKQKKIKYILNGKNCVSGVLNITFPGVSGQNLMINLDMEGIGISYGAACSSGVAKAPSVLLEIGLSNELAQSSVRISFGRSNKEEDVLYIVKKIHKVISIIHKGFIHA